MKTIYVFKNGVFVKKIKRLIRYKDTMAVVEYDNKAWYLSFGGFYNGKFDFELPVINVK